MPPTSGHEEHSLRILEAVESDSDVSQRTLATDLGIALGLTNLLVKRLVLKGWVRVIQVKPNRVSYLITPAGIAEKTRMTLAYFDSSLQFYRQTRDRIQQRFLKLSTEWPRDATASGKRIVFYGAGEVAEIGYVCVGETDLQLVGVVDASRSKPFFRLAVSAPDRFDGLCLDGQAFDRVVVMSFSNSATLRAEVAALRVPGDFVFWL